MANPLDGDDGDHGELWKSAQSEVDAVSDPEVGAENVDSNRAQEGATGNDGGGDEGVGDPEVGAEEK